MTPHPSNTGDDHNGDQARSVARSRAHETPAEELRAAVALLRNPTACWQRPFADRLADLLDHSADSFDWYVSNGCTTKQAGTVVEHEVALARTITEGTR